MAKKDEITLADTLIYALQELVAAMDNKNEKRIEEIRSFLIIISDTTDECFSGTPMKVIEFVDDMMASIGDYYHGSSFKSAFPTEDEMRHAFDD